MTIDWVDDNTRHQIINKIKEKTGVDLSAARRISCKIPQDIYPDANCDFTCKLMHVFIYKIKKPFKQEQYCFLMDGHVDTGQRYGKGCGEYLNIVKQCATHIFGKNYTYIQRDQNHHSDMHVYVTYDVYVPVQCAYKLTDFFDEVNTKTTALAAHQKHIMDTTNDNKNNKIMKTIEQQIDQQCG
jgi:hypothetical protein